jgi:hypothetical protein
VKASAFTIIALVLFVTLWAMAPCYHEWAHHPDEAAWVRMFMAPSGLLGMVLCLINLKAKNKYLMAAIYVVLLIHILIGLGLHPR